MCSSLIKRGFWLWLTLILLGGTSTWAQIYVSSQGGDVFVVNRCDGCRGGCPAGEWHPGQNGHHSRLDPVFTTYAVCPFGVMATHSGSLPTGTVAISVLGPVSKIATLFAEYRAT